MEALLAGFVLKLNLGRQVVSISQGIAAPEKTTGLAERREAVVQLWVATGVRLRESCCAPATPDRYQQKTISKRLRP
jgi:hypothetical protein